MSYTRTVPRETKPLLAARLGIVANGASLVGAETLCRNAELPAIAVITVALAARRRPGSGR